MGFNKSLFLNKNKENSEGGAFSVIDDGFYIAELTRCDLGNAKSSGRKQASFIWTIDDADEKYGGKTAGVFVGLTKDGKESEEGYKILDIVLNILGFYKFANLAEIEKFDEQQTEAWFNEKLAKLEGIKARLHITQKDGFQNVRVKKILSEPNYAAAESAPANYQHSNMDIPVDNKVTAPELIEDMPEEAVPFEQMTLEKGMNVKGTFNNQEVSGEIYAIDDAAKKVKIKVGNKLYPCNMDTIKVIA